MQSTTGNQTGEQQGDKHDQNMTANPESEEAVSPCLSSLPNILPQPPTYLKNRHVHTHEG